MRARLVFEKFSEDGDPIADMGIGSHAFFKNEYDKIKEFSIEDLKKYFNILEYMDDNDYVPFIVVMCVKMLYFMGMKENGPDAFFDSWDFWTKNNLNYKRLTILNTMNICNRVLINKYKIGNILK
jgi:hypothetical protein